MVEAGILALRRKTQARPVSPCRALVIVMRMGAVDLKPFVAIAANGKAGVLRDRQPDARMAQGTVATIAGDFPMGDDFGFGRCGGHETFLILGLGVSVTAAGGAGQDPVRSGPLALLFRTDLKTLRWSVFRFVAQTAGRGLGKGLSAIPSIRADWGAPVWLVRDYAPAGAGRRGQIRLKSNWAMDVAASRKLLAVSCQSLLCDPL